MGSQSKKKFLPLPLRLGVAPHGLFETARVFAGEETKISVAMKITPVRVGGLQAYASDYEVKGADREQVLMRTHSEFAPFMNSVMGLLGFANENAPGDMRLVDILMATVIVDTSSVEAHEPQRAGTTTPHVDPTPFRKFIVNAMNADPTTVYSSLEAQRIGSKYSKLHFGSGLQKDRLISAADVLRLEAERTIKLSDGDAYLMWEHTPHAASTNTDSPAHDRTFVSVSANGYIL
jgi:hypothetical protein